MAKILLSEFATYLTYVRKLGFEDTPDYDFLRGLMNKVLQRNNAADDDVYDWMLLDGRDVILFYLSAHNKHHLLIELL